MNRKAMALVEIVVSMLILAVAALAVTSTMSLVSSGQMRSAGGGSLDLQAAGYARETLEALKNSVSSNAATNGALLDNSYQTAGVPYCNKAFGVECGGGTLHNAEGPPLNGLPAGIDLLTKVSGTAPTAQRVYKVWDISSGACSTGGCTAAGNDVAYKKVKVCVAWKPDTCA